VSVCQPNDTIRTLLLWLCILLYLAPVSSWGQTLLQAKTGKTYEEAHGEKIYFPLGDLSFADKMVALEPGNPLPREDYAKPDLSLGPPDGPKGDVYAHKYVTLGCGGSLVLEFTDNILVDIDGPDLFVFEICCDVDWRLMA
jgi:OOP family OmpA-OmpF porin